MARSYEGSDWNSVSNCTLVLLGKSGNGKSLTGNSILGANYFASKRSRHSLTVTCQKQFVIHGSSRCVTVIDTPDLLQSSDSQQSFQQELMRIFELAGGRIHAFVLILSVRNKFSNEEIVAVDRLKKIFGDKLFNYMIVLFTGGDELAAESSTFEDYLDLSGSSERDTFQDLLEKCAFRIVLFDNKTRDHMKRSQQLEFLLDYVDSISEGNDGIPYSRDMLHEAEKCVSGMKAEAPESIFLSLQKEWELSFSNHVNEVNAVMEERFAMVAEKMQEMMSQLLSHGKPCLKREVHGTAEIEDLKKRLDHTESEQAELRRRVNSKCFIL